MTVLSLNLASLGEARYDSLCYQHSREFLCYFFLPKCDPVSKQIIHPCREMCLEFINGCKFWNYLNCDYLPSFNGDVPCVYSSVRCNKPPAVKNANIMAHFKGEYFLSSKAEYSCKEGFKMKQNRSIRCMYNGQWSTLPQCFPASQMQLPTSFKSKLFVTTLFTHFILGMVLTPKISN